MERAYSFVEFKDILETFRLTEEQELLVIKNKKYLEYLLAVEIQKILHPKTRFQHEEFFSDSQYPEHYKNTTTIVEERIIAIHNLFGLNPKSALLYAEKLKLKKRPIGSEHIFAMPNINALVKNLYFSTEHQKYIQAINILLNKIKNTTQFKNTLYYDIHIDSLILSPKTQTAFTNLLTQQENSEIILFDAQLGLCHRGESIFRAQDKFLPNETDITLFSLLSILLTDPQRFNSENQNNILNIYCAGNLFGDASNWNNSYCPKITLISNGKIKIEEVSIRYIHELNEPHYGLATMFLANT